MGIRRDNVMKIYMEGIRDGNARAACTAYTGHRYTQHSTGVGDGVEGFLTFFEPFLERNPKRDIEIVRIFEDGRNVFCQAFQSLNDGEAKWVTMDLFDTDSEGKIIEHWDTIAAYQEKTASGEDMVGGARDVEDVDRTEQNKERVLEFVKQVLQERNFDRAAEFVADDLIQHHPAIEAGGNAFADWLKSDEFGSYDMLFKLIGEGNFVMTYGKRHIDGKDHAVFNIYRLQNGMIVEHWENAEEIAPREQWGNTGKF